MRHRSGAQAFTDLLFNALLGFVVMFAIAYMLINPIAETGKIDPKAEILITLSWPDGRDDDVDLYVRDPAGELVWFRRREVGLMHLDRDDRGQGSDRFVVDGVTVENPRNQEVVAIRGIMPGEYIVNIHLYRASRSEPLPVWASLRIERLNPTVRLVFEDRVALERAGEERTVVRFAVAADGGIGGLSRLPAELVPFRRAPGIGDDAPERSSGALR